MKLNKTIGRVATTLVATAMLASLAAPAYADSAPTTSNEQISFTSTLKLNDDEKFATVPSASLTYTLSLPEDSDHDGVYQAATGNSPEILVGILPATTTQTVTFSNADSWTGTGNDTVTETVLFDFSGVVFTKPGIYRYVVTESDASTNNTNDFVSDGTNDRYLDLYVKNGEAGTTGADKYTVYSYVLVKSADVPTKAGNSVTYGDGSKNEGYEATYTTNEFDLSKVVTGDLGNKNPGAFSFTIEVSGLKTGDKIGLKAYGVTSYAPSGTASSEGKISIDGVNLGDGENYSIVGLPTGAIVKVTENLNANEGYTTSYQVNGGNAVTEKTANCTIVKQTDANTVVFTNRKDTITPTGIVMDVAPYALLVVIAAAGCFVFLRKRRED